MREELRSREPLVDMRMMAIRGVWTTNTVAFLIGVGMYSSFVLLPEFVQEPASTGYGFGASATAAGLFLLPATIAITVVGQMAGELERRIGSRGSLIGGARVRARRPTRCWWSTAAPSSTIYVAAGLLGIGIGLSFSAMANLIVENVRQDQTGVATGMNAVTRTLGGAFGGQLAATLLAGNLAASGHPDRPRLPARVRDVPGGAGREPSASRCRVPRRSAHDLAREVGVLPPPAAGEPERTAA